VQCSFATRTSAVHALRLRFKIPFRVTTSRERNNSAGRVLQSRVINIILRGVCVLFEKKKKKNPISVGRIRLGCIDHVEDRFLLLSEETFENVSLDGSMLRITHCYPVSLSLTLSLSLSLDVRSLYQHNDCVFTRVHYICKVFESLTGVLKSSYVVVMAFLTESTVSVSRLRLTGTRDSRTRVFVVG
jgi:hypothetical protein